MTDEAPSRWVRTDGADGAPSMAYTNDAGILVPAVIDAARSARAASGEWLERAWVAHDDGHEYVHVEQLAPPRPRQVLEQPIEDVLARMASSPSVLRKVNERGPMPVTPVIELERFDTPPIKVKAEPRHWSNWVPACAAWAAFGADLVLRLVR